MADALIGIRWTGEGHQFEGGAADGPRIRIDGSGDAAPSPMETMLLGIAACTAADIVDILDKMRVPLENLTLAVDADRAENPPRRWVRIRFVYRASGPSEADEPKLRRAVELSHEKYCSALSSLRSDVKLSTEVRLD